MTRQHPHHIAPFAPTALATALLSLLASGAVQAQDAPASDATQTITVTATRVIRAGFTAPTPTTSLAAEDLQVRGAANVADVLNELPAFRASVSPTGGSGGTFLASQLGVNLLDLRGLGAVRTLVMVNGRRHVPTTATGSVDINLIPTLLVGQVETVTGGASAAWGSDAVAGVVSIGLRNKLTGVLTDMSIGQSRQGDAQERKLGAAGGTAFADGKGQAILGVEYVYSGPVGDYTNRAWGRQEYGLLTNPLNGTNGQPRNIIGPAMHFATQNASGLVATGPLKGTTFDYNAATGASSSRAFNFGQTFGTSANMFGGEGYGVTNNTFQLLKAGVERYSVFGRASYEMSPALNSWVELSGAGVRAKSTNAPPRGNYTIKADNPYLPANVLAQMQANSLSSISIGRFDVDFGQQINVVTNNTQRVAAGLAGELFGGWSWDGYAQLGQTTVDTQNLNNLKTANLNASLDAVKSGTTIVCRNPNLTTTTATGVVRTADPGCVPVDLLGDGSVSAAALGYLLGTSSSTLKTQQQVVAANLRGEPFSTWAGPVSLSTGLEYRKEKADQDSDLISQQNGWNAVNNKPLHGAYSVTEGYVETVVPLVSRQPWAKTLDLNAAYRHTNYSTSGPVNTWKAGLTYEPDAQWLLRGTRSRDIRAPNVLELFSASVFSQPFVVGKDGVNRTTPIFTTGNLDLKPEVADTTTLGFAFKPAGLAGFKASADYYRIDLAGQITTLGGQQILNRCLAGAADLCSYITWTAAGQAGGVPASIINPNINLLKFKTSGVDLETDYRMKLDASSLDLRLLATRVFHFATTDNGGTTDRAGQSAGGGVPSWLFSTVGTYRTGPWQVSAQVRYIPKSIYDTTLVGPDNPAYDPTLANSISDNTVPARTYVNLSMQYELKLGQVQMQLYGVINNLLDRDPPLVPTANVMTNASYYDTIGRAYKVGARFKF